MTAARFAGLSGADVALLANVDPSSPVRWARHANSPPPETYLAIAVLSVALADVDVQRACRSSAPAQRERAMAAHAAILAFARIAVAELGGGPTIRAKAIASARDMLARALARGIAEADAWVADAVREAKVGAWLK